MNQKLPVKPSPFRGQTLELTATEVSAVMQEVAAAATAEEALAQVGDLWREILALEEEERNQRRRRSRTSSTNLVLIAGQLMALKEALTRHVQRHATAQRRPTLNGKT